MSDSAQRNDGPASRRTVVVGAGSAGGVVAARLSEDPSEHVILIEAGPDYATTEDLPEPLRDASNPSLDSHDWQLECHFTEPASEAPPMPYPRGKVLGGSSAVNAAIAQRGTPEDFQAWVDRGNDEWGWSNVLPYYKRLENDTEYGDDSEIHNDSGPIPILRAAREEWSPAAQAIDVGFRNRGFDSAPDLNDPTASGFGPTPRNKIGIFRASSGVTYLKEARERPNLEIRAETDAVRVVFDGNRAVGVEVEHDGERETIAADRVVLSGGAVKTPQILTLSGVGPKAKLEELGVELLVDSPGVGRNLQDHPYIPLVHTASGNSEPRYGFETELRYTYSEDGPSNDCMVFPGVIEASALNFEMKEGVEAGVVANAILAKPSSVGWIDVTSADHTVQPELHLNFMDEQIDTDRLTHTVRLVAEVLASEPMAAEIDEPLVFPDPDTLADDEKLHAWMREVVTTAYHCAGTCRMGPDGDDEAVVTQRLEVRGTENLYVADASVMPEITNGLTNITCYMIGEKLADWLRDKEVTDVAA
jgi:choline dehydrogenase